MATAGFRFIRQDVDQHCGKIFWISGSSTLQYGQRGKKKFTRITLVEKSFSVILFPSMLLRMNGFEGISGGEVGFLQSFGIGVGSLGNHFIRGGGSAEIFLAAQQLA